MFEVGFWELVLIMVIALLVLGPERLPQLARTVGLWLGKARGMARTIKAEIDRELAADELKRIMAKQASSSDPFEMIEKPATPSSATVSEPAAPPPQPAADGATHDGKA